MDRPPRPDDSADARPAAAPDRELTPDDLRRVTGGAGRISPSFISGDGTTITSTSSTVAP